MASVPGAHESVTDKSAGPVGDRRDPLCACGRIGKLAELGLCGRKSDPRDQRYRSFREPVRRSPVIMVRSVSGSSEEIVVGAVLKQGSTILLGKKRIGLDRLRPGDDVTLKYSKTRDGLVVRSIVLHRH